MLWGWEYVEARGDGWLVFWLTIGDEVVEVRREWTGERKEWKTPKVEEVEAA